MAAPGIPLLTVVWGTPILTGYGNGDMFFCNKNHLFGYVTNPQFCLDLVGNREWGPGGG